MTKVTGVLDIYYKGKNRENQGGEILDIISEIWYFQFRFIVKLEREIGIVETEKNVRGKLHMAAEEEK